MRRIVILRDGGIVGEIDGAVITWRPLCAAFRRSFIEAKTLLWPASGATNFTRLPHCPIAQ
jgi:hypothetical protein